MKLTKLTERDDIKAYLTTFERMMVSYEIKPDRWVFKLAPQLTRKLMQRCIRRKQPIMKLLKRQDMISIRRAIVNGLDLLSGWRERPTEN